jgi:hypothetical protein
LRLAHPGVVDFEAYRRALTGLAYRMLGSRAEAEDVVQVCAGMPPTAPQSRSRAVISARWSRGSASIA